MNDLGLLLLGGAGGFVLHTLSMKISFKQRTIENKIKIYDDLIVTWVKMRNFIYANHTGEPLDVMPDEIAHHFDQMYGSSQQLVGEAFLFCEDVSLTTDINGLNETLFRTEWHRLNFDEANATIEQFKVDALQVVMRMRDDVKSSTRLEWHDFKHIVLGFVPSYRRRKSATRIAAGPAPSKEEQHD